MVTWHLWCFYIGEIVSWMTPIIAATLFGYHVATKFGSWKAFWIDFTTEEEDKK